MVSYTYEYKLSDSQWETRHTTTTMYDDEPDGESIQEVTEVSPGK